MYLTSGCLRSMCGDRCEVVKIRGRDNYRGITTEIRDINMGVVTEINIDTI